jgi:hypothetical protein
VCGGVVPAGALPPVADPVGHTPGGSVLRSAQPITFSDFCQVVDMQFLTHIRRGTSISVCDFAPSSLPQDLSKALELLSVTSECLTAGREVETHLTVWGSGANAQEYPAGHARICCGCFLGGDLLQGKVAWRG